MAMLIGSSAVSVTLCVIVNLALVNGRKKAEVAIAPGPPAPTAMMILTSLAFVIVAIFFVSFRFIFWRPRPVSAKSSLALQGSSAIACGKGGYDALTGVPLHGSSASRGARAAFDGITDDDCVTVRIAAAGVNYADVCIRWGLYTSWNQFGGGRRPGQEDGKGDVPGFEFAGEVESVGRNVTHVKVGDQSFGVSLFGAYSSRIVVPGHQIFIRPSTLTAHQAAALPCVAMTSWFAVQQQASPIGKGKWVLVHSAAGGGECGRV